MSIDRMAQTAQNKDVGAFLAATRLRLGDSQPEFAARIASRLGMPVAGSTISSYEHGARLVPAPVLVVALELAGREPLKGERQLAAEIRRLDRADERRLSELAADVRARLKTTDRGVARRVRSR